MSIYIVAIFYVAFTVNCIVLFHLKGKGTIESATYGQIFNSEAIYQDGYNKKLLYTPKTAFTEDLMQRIRLKLYTADEGRKKLKQQQHPVLFHCFVVIFFFI